MVDSCVRPLCLPQHHKEEKKVRSREERIRRDKGNVEGKFRVIHNSQYRVSRAYELSNYSIRKLAASLFGFFKRGRQENQVVLGYTTSLRPAI